MILNFIKIAWRQLTRNRIFTIINITGLAIGIACGLVIYKIISYESGYNKYHKNYSNIYRLINQYKVPEEGLVYSEGQAHPLGGAIRNDFPQMTAAMTFYAESGQIAVENTSGNIDRYLEDDGLVYAEPQIFEIFDFNFLAGDPQNALKNTGSIVINVSLAQKYFNLKPGQESDALDKSISINNKGPFTITGIFEDLPETITIRASKATDWRLYPGLEKEVRRQRVA